MINVGFVGGFGRSGSTLLERIIGETPGVCPLGEVVHLWQRGVLDNERCSCGNPFHSCNFWCQVGAEAFGGWDRVDVGEVLAMARRLDRTRYIPLDAAATTLSRRWAGLRDYAEYFRRIYAASAHVSGASTVIDSSKNASTAFALRAQRGISLRVVQVVRDSRGAAYAWTKTIARPEATGRSAQPLMQQYKPWMSALLWDANNAAFELLRRLGTPVHTVCYEAFLQEPVAVVTGIAEFLRLSTQGIGEILADRTARLSQTHQVAGNPMRFQVGDIELRSDDQWRRDMSPAARRLVAALTLPLMARYRYLSVQREA